MKRVVGTVLLIVFFSLPAFGKNLIPLLSQKEPGHWQPPKVVTKKLPNGFQLYLMPDHKLPLFKAKVFIKVGSAYESHRLSGLADILATLIVTGGTEKKTPLEVDQWLDERAIHLTASAGRELTTVSISCLAHQWEEALDFLAEVLLSPRWDQKRFQLAISRYKEGLRREKDRPNVILSRAFQETIYGKKHPWGTLPTRKTLRRIKRKGVIQFYQKYFHPGEMLLAVAGDFSQKKVRRWSQKRLGSLPVVPVSQPNWEELPFKNSPEKKKIKKKLTQVFIEVGHFGLKRHSKDQYAYRLLQYILGGETFTSRLGKDIRTTRGLAYTVYSHWSTNPVRGMFKIHVETKVDTKETVLERIFYHLKRLHTKGDITRKELKRAKEALLNQYIFWFDSPFDFVMTQAKLDLLGFPPNYLRRYPNRIRAVTLADVQAVAKNYIQPEGLKIVVVGP